MTADLSHHHQPLTQLFETPQHVDNWNQYRLSNDQLEFFQANGYLSGIRVLHDEQVDVLRRELDSDPLTILPSPNRA